MMSNLAEGMKLPLGGAAADAGPMTVMGSNILTPRPPPNSARGEHAELLDMLARLHEVQLQPRLSAVSVECCCKSASREVSDENAALYDSDLESDSDSSDDSDAEMHEVHLSHVLKAFNLYEGRPIKSRNPITLCNLVLGYNIPEDVTDEQTQQILLLCSHTDLGLREASLLLIGQLSQREENAFKFMLHDAVTSLLDLLDSEVSPAMVNAACRALQKIMAWHQPGDKPLSEPMLLFRHRCLEDLWAELMIIRGLSVLLQRLAPHQVPSVRQSAGEVLAVLAGYHSMAMMLLDQGMDTLVMLKGLNSEAREVYISIVTAIVLHTDHTCAEMLDTEVLPSVIHMLKLGLCGSQVRCLSFLSALCVSAIGLPALLELKAVPAILSALVDSKCRKELIPSNIVNVIVADALAPCVARSSAAMILTMQNRKVRCGAAECLSHLVAVQRSSFQKQVFVQVDTFFHDHEMSLWREEEPLEGQPRGAAPFRTNTSTRIQQGLTDLIKTVVAMLEKEARMEKDRFNKVVSVHLTPTVDVDTVTLATLKHLSLTLGHMTQLKVNRPKIKKILAAELEDSQWLEAWRGLSGDANPQVCLLLVDGGALCVLDLLHTYSLRLHATTGILPLLPPEVTLHGQPLPKIVKAWGLETQGTSRPSSAMPVNSKLFTANETDLILSLINVACMFAECTHKHVSRDVEAELKQAMEEYKFNEINNNGKNSEELTSSGTSGANDNVQKLKTNKKHSTRICTDKGKHGGRQCGCSKVHLSSPADVGNTSAAVEPGVEELERSLGVLWRLLRTDVYEAGILESVAPWLSWREPQIQVAVLHVLSSMMQPVPETIHTPLTPTHQTRRNKKIRPISAYSMTTKEKEHVIAKALYQMSPNSSDLIQRAMGQPVTSKDPIELAKGDASQAIKDFISDLDRTGVLKGKQYNDIVSSVLAQEQEVMQRAGDRRHSEGDHLGSHTGRTKDNHNPTLLVRPPSGRPLSGRPLSGKSVSSRPQSGKSVGSRPQSGRLDGTTSQSVPSYMIGNSPPQQDGKSPANRPQSAKSLCNLFNKTSPGMDHHQFTDATSCKPAGSRPQSAKSQASSTGSRPASGKKPPSVIIRPPSGRKTSLITSSGKTSGDSVVKSDATVNYGRPLSGKSSVSTEGSTNPSTFSQQPGVVRQLTRSQSAPMARRGSSARPGSAKLSTTNAAWFTLVEHLSQQGPLPWRPSLSRNAAVTEQCQGRVAEICGTEFLHTLLAKPSDVAQKSALLVEQLSRIGKAEMLMKLSTHGLVPNLVDYLRVWDQQPEMLVLGLLVVRQIVSKDIRLCQLFHRHGGTALLMAMSSKQSGFLRNQVAVTLKKVTTASKINGACNDHEGHQRCNKVTKVPDIWDRIMRRWLNEDRVMLMLRKKVES